MFVMMELLKDNVHSQDRVLYNLKNSEGPACLNKQNKQKKNLPFEPVSESCLKL